MAKDPKHDRGPSIAQDSARPSGSIGRPYKSGSKAGSGGAKSDPDGGAPAAQPHQKGWSKPSR